MFGGVVGCLFAFTESTRGALHCENFPPVWFYIHFFQVLEVIARVVLKGEEDMWGE